MDRCATFVELKINFSTWCEEEGVEEEPPILIRVDSLKRTKYPFMPIVEQSEEDYVNYCIADNKEQEREKDVQTVIKVHFDSTDPYGLKGLQVQGKLVSAPLSCAVGRIVEYYDTLTTLKLIRCSLVAESMYMLGYLLKKANVTHLYLDENVIPDENYHLILKENHKLLHYSLRLNNIKNRGATNLAESLKYTHPHHQILRSLNLNCNLISDDGACELAEALRWNRNLTCLSLAGNLIGDKGAQSLARLFLPFSLTHEELELRADLICNRLIQIKTIMEETPQQNFKEQSNQEFSETEANPPTYPGELSDLNDLMHYYYELEKWAESKVPIISNPIVSDVIELENGGFSCKGNDALWYLNLSYNLLTEESLVIFMQAFRHQENSIMEFDRKIWQFDFEGNPYDQEHPVVEELEKYFYPFKSKLSLQGSNSRRGSKASMKS